MFLGNPELAERNVKRPQAIVTKAALLFTAVVLLLIAAVRRCSFVGVVAVVGFGWAVVGAEVLKDTLPWRAPVPNDGLFERGFQTGTYPKRTRDHRHRPRLELAFGLVVPLATVVSGRWRLRQLNICNRRLVCRLASAV
jgi:hypothetical protein